MYSDYSAEYRASRENTKRLYAGKEVWAFLDENEFSPRKLLVDRDGYFQFWFLDREETQTSAHWEHLHPQVSGFPYVNDMEPDEDWASWAYATKEAALSARNTEIARRKVRDSMGE